MDRPASFLIAIDRRHHGSLVDDFRQPVVPHFDDDSTMTDAGDAILDIPGESEGIRFAVEFTNDGGQNIKHRIDLAVSP